MLLGSMGIQRRAFEHAECGCYTESEFSEDDELLELHVYICEDHMAKAREAIELQLLLKNSQLTLPLPSPGVSG